MDFQAHKYRFFTVAAIGTFMATLDGSILNVALPSIAKDLNCTVDLAAWVVLSYSLTLISLMLIFGAWTERRGFAFAYKFGYVFFLVGSIVCATSDSIYMLIMARVVQAIGTAMFAAVGPAMITAIFPADQRGKGIGLIVMTVSAGFVSGPPLGGYLLGIWSWHSIFLMNIPIGLFGMVLTYTFFRGMERPATKKKIPLAATFCISTGLVSGVFALSLVGDYRFTEFQLWLPTLLAVVGLSLFVALESKPKYALIGLGIFKNRQFTTSLVAQTTHFIGVAGIMLLIPFYLERVRGFEPQQVGMYLVILPIMMFIFGPLSGQLSDKIGYRILTGSGLVIHLAGLWMLTYLTPTTEGSYLAACLVVMGAGVGLFGTPNSSALMGSVGTGQRAVTSGILATNRNIGIAVGVALSTAIFTYYRDNSAPGLGENAAFAAALKPVFYTCMASVALGLVMVMLRGNRDTELAAESKRVKESG